MSKIAISCIILAACISFQEIQADPLFNPIDALLDKAQKVVTGGKNVVTEATEAIQNIPNGVSKLGGQLIPGLNIGGLNKGGALLPGVDISSCLKVYNEGRNKSISIVNQLKSNFNNCLSNETQNTDGLKTLTDLVNDLQKNLSAIAQNVTQNVMQCTEGKNLWNISSCIPQIRQIIKEQNYNQLQSISEKIKFNIKDLISIAQKTSTCYAKKYQDNVQQDVRNLFNDTIQCYRGLKSFKGLGSLLG